MLARRRFVRLAGLSGLSLFGIPWLGGCAEPETLPNEPEIVPLPDDPSKGWWVRQNYAPVEESEALKLEIVGALPPSLTGLYLRNGPNPLSGDSGHWFLGDGMVHGVMLENGKAPWYRARYIQTEVLGVDPNDDGPVGPPGLTSHQANTSVLHHAGRLLCLDEIGLPYEISAKDLSTLGPYDFGGLLTTAMTAHPRVDPATGELFFFAYGLLEPAFTYHRTDASGLLVASEKIKLPAAVMMHDFQLTETHAVFMDLPILFDIQMAIDGAAFPFKWSPENGSRIGVMPRNGTAEDVQWFTIPTCFAFHTWNAFHDPADPGVIHLDCVRYDTMWEKGPSAFTEAGHPTRFSIDTSNGQVTSSALSDLAVEFPRINPARQGRSYRYGYSIGASKGKPPGSDAPAATNLIVKHDRQTGNDTMFELADGQQVDETLFVADPSATNEDDGWLLAYVFDHADNRSQLFVLDATDLSKTVARVKLPTRVPHGFHGELVPTKA